MAKIKELDLRELNEIIGDSVILNRDIKDVLKTKYGVEYGTPEYQAYHDQLHEYIYNVIAWK